MSGFSFETFVVAFAVIGIVIIVSALLSGLIERSGLPQVAVFLAIGAALGPAGLGVLNITLGSQTLHVVATLSLTPVTLLPAALGTFAAWWLLHIPLAAATILGAALASTDPVLLRGLLRRRDI